MRLLTVQQTAELLTISKRKAYDLVATGKLPHYRIDNTIRIDEADVEDYLADCRVARQAIAVEASEEPRPRSKRRSAPQSPIRTSHLRVGPKQLALLQRGGVGTSAPGDHSAG